jgi:hypothetical protein
MFLIVVMINAAQIDSFVCRNVFYTYFHFKNDSGYIAENKLGSNSVLVAFIFLVHLFLLDNNWVKII